MISSFNAFRVHRVNGKIESRLEKISIDQLGDGEVLVKVHFSSLNYKDALGPMGRAPIQRRFPLIVGIDLVGEVVSSESTEFSPGDLVIANGCDLGEKINGGFTEYVRVPASILMPLPPSLSPINAMTIGTAGFSAALALKRMNQCGQTPSQGPILVSGASGGVGSFAVKFFSSYGYEVLAVSGKTDAKEFLLSLGAHEVLTPDQIKFGSSPLEVVRWGGAVDNIGGEFLAGLIRHTQLWGSIASIGLAGGSNYEGSVMPHILRGVNILGISSNNCPMPLRRSIWNQLAQDYKPETISLFRAKTIPLGGLLNAFQELLERKVTGRIVVDCRS